MASRAVINLLDLEDCQLELLEHGGVDTMIRFLADPEEDETLQTDALNMVQALTEHDKLRGILFEKHPELFKLIADNAAGANADIEQNVCKLAFETLVTLAEKKELRSHFLKDNILAMFATKLPRSKTELSEIHKSIVKLFASLTLVDNVIEAEFFNYLPDFVTLLGIEDTEVLLSALLIIGNLARTDDYCKRLVNNDLNVVTKLLKLAQSTDIRVQRLTFGALRNLCTLGEIKEKFRKEGLIPIIVTQLGNKENAHAHIQYGIIGVIRAIIANGGDEYLDLIIKEGGLKVLTMITSGELEPKPNPMDEPEDPEAPKEKDKRVVYEATRILARIAEKPMYQEMFVQEGGIASLLELVKAQYPILQCEGIKGLHCLVKGGYKNQVAASKAESVLQGITSPPEVAAMWKETLQELQAK